MAIRRALGCLALVGALMACSPPPGAQTPSPSPAAQEVTHASGSTDLVFRIAVGGGFAGLEMRPQVSIFGDGTVVYLDDRQPFPPRVGDVRPQRPYRMARLSEDHVQAVLRAALPAIGPARASYTAEGADYFTYLYTLRAGGVDKDVSLFGLEAGVHTGPDAAAWAAFGTLGRAIAAELAAITESAIYAPSAFVARLWRHMEPAQGLRWPWAELTLEDFSPTPHNTAFERRLTAAEVAVLGIPDVDGGLEGVVLVGSDGTLYDLVIRPLLPDETR